MTELRSHYELEDLGGGKFRHIQHIKPIAYSKNGVWRRIANKIGATGDPGFPLGVDEAVQFRMKSKLVGQSPLIYFGKGPSHIRFTPLNTNNNIDGAVGFGGQGLSFYDAWPNADLRFLLGGHRLQKDILLKAGHPTQFQFRIDDHAGLNQDTLETPEFRILAPVLQPPAGNPAQSIPLTWGKSTQGGKLILTATLPPGNWSGWTLDPTLTLQPDAADGRDTTLWQDAPGYSSNSDTDTVLLLRSIVGGRHIGLMWFDLSSIGTATITAATLTMVWGGSDTNTKTITLKAILAANSGWNENAWWNYANSVTLLRWAGDTEQNGGADAGCSIDGTDVNAINLGQASFGNTPVDTQATFDLSTSQVQDWLVSNHGFRITTNYVNNIPFYTSDSATAANRPKLVVTYSVPSQSFVRSSMWGTY